MLHSEARFTRMAGGETRDAVSTCAAGRALLE
jgi:hypothetical protein